jgi:hypothetical protein
MCGGANGAQTGLAAQSGNFYTTLQGAYNSQFGQYSGILNNLQNAWTPVLNGGPNQQGFSAAENSTLNSEAINNTATNAEHAEQAANEQVGAEGGGNSFLPSGAQSEIDANIDTNAENNLSNEQSQITQANYNQGRQNFEAASGALSGVAAADNPTGFAGAAGGEGNQAFEQQTQISDENNAGSWATGLTGALTGIAGSFAGGFGSGLGKGFGGGGSNAPSNNSGFYQNPSPIIPAYQLQDTTPPQL